MSETGFVICPRCQLNWLKRGWDITGCPRCDAEQLRTRLATAEALALTNGERVTRAEALAWRLANELFGVALDVDGECLCDDASGLCECGGDGQDSDGDSLEMGCAGCWAKRLREVAAGIDWPARVLAPTEPDEGSAETEVKRRDAELFIALNNLSNARAQKESAVRGKRKAEAERDELRGRLKATEEKRDWWHRLHGDATLALQAARAELDGNLAKRDAYLARLTEDDGRAANPIPAAEAAPTERKP